MERTGPYTLDPGQFVLGQTLEYVELPMERPPVLAARIEGRSSFARCGLLVAGEPICQLILEVVDDPPFENPSQFQGQTDPAGRTSPHEKR